METTENPTNNGTTDASNGHASENPTNGESKTTGLIFLHRALLRYPKVQQIQLHHQREELSLTN